MRYIFIVLLIFITSSCQTGTPNPTTPLIPLEPSDPTIPLIPLEPSTPTIPLIPLDPSTPTGGPSFPNLEVNSWKYLESSRKIGVTPIGSEHITVSDNNTPYISFTKSTKLYVYRWAGSDWIQVGKEISLETGSIHDSLITYNNVPYITYKNNVKKLENNSWVNALNNISLPTGENFNSLSLHTHKDKLYLTYISDSDKKLHVKTLENNSWKNYGETPVVLDPKDGFSGSMNNGIQMAFYNNTPYTALKNFYYQNPRILVLRNNKWEYIEPTTTPGGDSVNSDYFFYIDSSGTMYLSFLKGVAATVGSFKIFKKSMSATSWQQSTPFPNQVYGYQTVLYDKELYIASSPSIEADLGIGTVAGPVLFNKFNSALDFDNKDGNTISDDPSTGSHVKLAIKDNRIFAMYVDYIKDSIVVKSALLK